MNLEWIGYTSEAQETVSNFTQCALFSGGLKKKYMISGKNFSFKLSRACVYGTVELQDQPKFLTVIFRSQVTSCKWISLTKGKLAAQIYVIVHVTVTFFIPLAIAWGTFVHLWLMLKKSAFNSATKYRARTLMYPLRMCAFTAFFLGICWLPNQFFFLLSKFDVTQLDTPVHHVTVVLSMFNSCLNPWIYGATNKKYRNEFKKILCFWKRNGEEHSETDVIGEMTLQNVNRNFLRVNGGRANAVTPPKEL